MPLLLALLLIVVGVVEIVVIGQIQALVGWPLTIALLLLTSVLGGYLVRQQGARAWRRLGEAMRAGRLPAAEAVDGALVLLGGALLLSPGFVTDLVGLGLLLPPTRGLISRALQARIDRSPGTLGSLLGSGTAGRRGRRTASTVPPTAPLGLPGVIDVEVVEVRRTSRDEPTARPDAGPPS